MANFEKPILDACCGSKMFWFDKNNPAAVFCDNRELSVQRSWGKYNSVRHIEVHPDILCDFTDLPFPDNHFKLVVFDPPHLLKAGDTAWLALKYGKLSDNWTAMIHDGFWECMRVLDDYGTLIFRWSEVQIPLSKVLAAIGMDPLFGHRSGKQSKTHWMAFMKMPEEVAHDEF